MNMDGSSTGLGESIAVNEKLTAILAILQKKQATENEVKPGLLKTLQESLFPEQKAEKNAFRRLKQKQKTFQGVPVTIDSITPEGRRDLRRIFSNLFSFKLDTKKLDEKSGPWAKLFFIIAFVVGFLVGAILQVFKDLKSLFKIISTKLKGLFLRIKNTKLGQAITNIFRSVKLKFLKAIRYLKSFSIVKTISGFFKSLKLSLSSKFKFITDFALKAFENIKSSFMKIFSKVRGFITRIQKFFKPITDFLGKFNVGKILSTPGKLFKSFLGFFGKLSGFFKLGLKLGRLVGKLLWPLFAIIETVSGLFKAFTDPKLQDKSFIQKMITGLVAGIAGFFDIFSIFGLELFGFDEIRDRFDKIFEAFKKGFFNGIGEWYNQIMSYAYGLIGKVVGWIVGWFNKDAGNAITEWSKNFDLGKFIKEMIGSLVGWFKKIFDFVGNIGDTISKAYEKIKGFATGLYDKIISFVKGVVDAIANIFNIRKIKDWIKEKLGFGPKVDMSKTDVKVTEVGDYMEKDERTLYTQRGAVSFDKNDELLALKKGGPINDLLNRTTQATTRSLDNLTVSVKEINTSFDKFIKTATALQQNELKLMNENLNLLREIKDKETSSSVVVQNNANSNIFSEKISSNLEYRKDLSTRTLF